MNLTLSGTNVIVLYGEGAVSHFPDLISRWNNMLSYNQWDGLQFILVGEEAPKLQLEESVAQRVNNGNTRFFRFQDAAPDESIYYGMIYDKVRTGTVNLHLICDAGEGKLAYDWAEQLVKTAVSVEALSTHCFYYFHFGWKSGIGENEQIICLIRVEEGSAFLLGDSNEFGAYVRSEDRWYATELAVLMNSAGQLPVSRGAFSLGYSSLNANGSELTRLCESAGCQALREILEKTVTNVSEAEMTVRLLPEGLESVAGMHDWLTAVVRDRVQPPKTGALRNAWITIRMNHNLPAAEAVRRMKRFVDLNYAGNESITENAKDLAETIETEVRERLCGNVLTASLSPQVFREIASGWHGIASLNPEPNGCTYPKPPLMMKIGRGVTEYEEQCKAQVINSIRMYILEKNRCVFAGELEKAYQRLAVWLSRSQGADSLHRGQETALGLLRDFQKELDNPENGNAIRLRQKYRSYAETLDAIRPSLSSLTEGMEAVFFDDRGTPVEKAWRQLVREAGKNMEKRIPAEYRGDFFRVLNREFSTKEDREKFFEEYLKSGPRMYRHLQAIPSAGVSVLLADERLTDSWFTRQNIFQVRTDNAENLTLYPLGRSVEELMKDTTVYFRGEGNPGQQTGGIGLFGETARGGENPKEPESLPGQNLFETQSPTAVNADFIGAISGVRLEPDERNEYRLYWKWNGNDPTAMVELFQEGEKVGKVSVIPVRRFKENGDNMNVTEDIMGGRPIPVGMLTVTIRDDNRSVYVEGAEVTGRREVVRYKLNNQSLSLKPDTRSTVAKLTLRTTDTDGTYTFYPLYPAAEGEEPWRYEGLQLSDGKIVTDPSLNAGQIFAIKVGD